MPAVSARQLGGDDHCDHGSDGADRLAHGGGELDGLR